jgi:hypothetical protein
LREIYNALSEDDDEEDEEEEVKAGFSRKFALNLHITSIEIDLYIY